MRWRCWSLQKNGTGAYGVGVAAGELGEQVAGGGRALLGGVRPVLDAHLLVEAGVRPAGDVAGGVDAAGPAPASRRRRRRRAARARCPPATPSPARRRCRPRSTSAGTTVAVGQRHAACRTAPSPPRRSGSSMPSARGRRWRRAPSPRRGRGRAAPAAPPARSPRSPWPRRRGDLEADEPGADDDDPGRAVGDPRPQGERVVERAQLVDGADVCLAGQPPGPRAGGEDDAVEGDARAVGELRPPGRRRRAPSAGTPRRRSRPSSSIASGWRRAMRSGSHSPGEQLLRQRRAVVGQVRLGADQRDRPGVAVGAQRLARPAGRPARPRRRRSPLAPRRPTMPYRRAGRRRPGDVGAVAPGARSLRDRRLAVQLAGRARSEGGLAEIGRRGRSPRLKHGRVRVATMNVVDSRRCAAAGCRRLRRDR